MAINDWITIQTLFDKLNKQLEKAQKVSEPSGLPRARDGAHDALIAKNEEIFERAATARHDDRIDVLARRALQRLTDFPSGIGTLNRRFAPHDAHVRGAVPQNFHEVEGTVGRPR